MKKWIGLVPKCKVGDPEKSCMDDYILVGHNYAQRIIEAGMHTHWSGAGEWLADRRCVASL